MNLYLARYRVDGNTVESKVIRHTHGEKAAQVMFDELRSEGESPNETDIEVTLLLPDGRVGIIEHL